jgi:serine/threonine protein kinase/tetratricopeptide (TPR) repeat protein
MAMKTPDRMQQIEELFLAALEHQPGERTAYLSAACGSDAKLVEDVQKLIAAHEQSGSFMDSPAYQSLAEHRVDPATQLQIGHQLGQYRILGMIGRGGMGEVYLAQDSRLRRRVALKLLPAHVTRDEQRLKRFQQEAYAASALSHPNILTVYDIGEQDDAHFIATEYIEGETLRQLMKRVKVTLELTLEIALQIAAALSAAHATGIIHRDIKPENIMVRPDGYVKVLDFGLAKLVGPAEPQTGASALQAINTETGMVMGTINYMSPEQARGKALDVRTDIFSFGIVLYEMVAGCVPFAGESGADVLVALLEKDPLPLAELAPDVPPELQRIVSKTLRRERDRRYQTMQDLLADLKALREEIQVQAKLERSGSLEPGSGGTRPKALIAGQEASSEARARSINDASARTTSSAEYLVSEIKQHKKSTLLVLLVVVIAAIGLGYYLLPKNPEAALDSIAVLPFVNQNQDPETEYRSDGLTESIINDLAQLPALRVIARSSVFRYKGKETDPLKAGKELGVRAVLTGRLLQRGDSLSISVELMDVRENKQLWGQQYEQKVADLLSMQRNIARDISANLRLKLSGADRSRASKHYTESAAAYQLYLKGRFYWNERTGEALKKSIDYFNQAIEIDPGDALSYAGLADAFVLIPNYSAGSPQEYYPKAKAAARKALELDETLAEAHTSLAQALFAYDWNFAESSREFQRGIELNPNYATARHWYANSTLLAMGRFDEAIAEGRRARELDPLSLIINADLGADYFYARQYDNALEQLRKTIEMDQGFYTAQYFSGMAYAMKGAFPEAIAAYKRAQQLSDDPFVLAYLGHAFAASGKREEALKTLNQLKAIARQRYVPAYGFAIIYAAIGEKDQAFQWLEKLYQDRAFDLAFIKVDPFFDTLRSDPRFADLARRVGI